MNLLNSIVFIAAEGEPHRDDNGQIVTHHWLLPEAAELIYGTLASLIIFGLLYKFAGPAIKKGFNARTERIQAELDASAEAKAEASAEAAKIRQASGDIDAERQRLFAEADQQAEALLASGRARLDQEVADMEARAEAEASSASSRAGDELRAEITRLSAEATDRVMTQALDGSTQQQLIESFIARVGATGATS